ncbi:MAG: DEAD/DEAH box helicase [Lentisphaeria bacterium]|nr:DEAD/DEAH box helicase [Lentisphaeria bacterium]MDY0175476.1 DEAD/DEAH box helicase [Lentisphaeria bacterium]NLZ59144.1 DEAD/DEAH box helicase [Lentisphaerota bacterium]
MPESAENKLNPEFVSQLQCIMSLLCAPAELSEIERIIYLAARHMPRLARLSSEELETLAEQMHAEKLLQKSGDKWELRSRSMEKTRQLLAKKQYVEFADFVARAVPAIGNRGLPDLDYLKRDIRNAFFAADARLLNSSLVNMRDYFPDEYNDAAGFEFLLKKSSWSELKELPSHLIAICSWQLLPLVIRQLRDIGDFEEKLIELGASLPMAAVYPLIDYLILKGDWNQAAALMKKNPNNNARMLRQAWLSSIFGKDERAVNLYLDSLYEVRQLEGVHDFYFQTVGGLFFIFSLLRSGSTNALNTAESNAELASKVPTWGIIYEQLQKIVSARRTQEQVEKLEPPKNLEPLPEFFWLLGQYWMNSELDEDEKLRLEKITALAKSGGYLWLTRECEELLLRCNSKQGGFAHRFHEDPIAQMPFILDSVQVQNSWLSRISKFDSFFAGLPERKLRRLVWLVSVDVAQQGLLTVRPMEQHAIKSGRWSKGRKFTAFRNQNYCRIEQDLDSFMSGYQLSAQDKFACTIMREAMSKIEENPACMVSAWASVFLALAEHPRLLLEGNTPRELRCITAMPYVRLLKCEKHYEFQLCPQPKDEELIVLRLEHGDLIKVFLFDNEFLQLRQLIGKELRLPVEEEQEMLELLRKLSKRYQILSDCPLDCIAFQKEMVEAKPEFRLLPENQGLRIEILLSPFGETNGFYKPGQGPMEMLLHQETAERRLCRDFELELKNAALAAEACPALQTAEKIDQFTWRLPEPQDCYEFVLQLRNILSQCQVHWPQNSRYANTRTVELGNLSLRVQNYKDWFVLDGEVQLDDDKKVSLREILQKSNEEKGRFIILEDGQVLALSDSFRRRLDDLHRISELRNDSFRVHHFLQPVLHGLFAGTAGLETDAKWQEEIERLEAAMQLQPEVPKTLQGELRKYQREGFTWLYRLDALGAGACLADDMGLGKTIQAITLILSKAHEGPSLVIAPTSVCANWQQEFQKFAPSLEIVTLGNTERKETLAALKENCVLISSYGLLQSENEQFSGINWRVAVLDEAQAIKNYHAKRSQAAMNIKAQFRLVTTGTPVENNLNELWAVFRFINPGLLGSRESFQRRFGIPIEREENKEVMSHLTSLIKPFLLRRRKDQVLKELPPKTNVDFRVKLSEEEQEFYKGLRKGILADLEKRQENDGRLRIRVLAGITKLRLATCHPRLVAPNSLLPGSKLEAFLELLDEILDGGHKVLVFSQFVKFLSIVRSAIEERGIEYQYLDGSLSGIERNAAVSDFQAGNCPVFLISLKAGGLGLNLTQADYVIHLDSWWNPAVENQASDRAHRLGQDKPVTIYHLLAKDTIEEKIQNLHQWKRDLADQLLSGTETMSSINVHELINLLKEDLP